MDGLDTLQRGGRFCIQMPRLPGPEKMHGRSPDLRIVLLQPFHVYLASKLDGPEPPRARWIPKNL
jgi:hypothetical protein